MSDDLLENAIVAAQDQYGDPPAKYAPGNNMPASVTVMIIPVDEYQGQRPPTNPLEQQWWDRHGTVEMHAKWPTTPKPYYGRQTRGHFDPVLAHSLGWVSPEDHDRRVTELLNANNKLIEERRLLEATTVDVIKTILRSIFVIRNEFGKRPELVE